MTATDSLLSRRKAILLGGLGAIAGVSMGNLGSCSTTPQQVLPTVIDAVISVMAPACQVIPAIATLVDVIAAAFPAAVGVATISDAVAQQIAKYICGLFTNAGVVPDGKSEATLKGKMFSANVNGKAVNLHGYTTINGKIVSF